MFLLFITDKTVSLLFKGTSNHFHLTNDNNNSNDNITLKDRIRTIKLNGNGIFTIVNANKVLCDINYHITKYIKLLL